ncbi:putative succinoglycan biosynthesis transport protein [Acetobacter nitrogenifigens DSM 23921 = NBRC 105050]|uniref:Polysaccharide biosynthesis protein n=1 Tax=Acetobacter nitrogenifigens DSM 23921 = NBRC 105050 TaxID=1120919 RepID=A0A511X5I4_9PROT|nr:polysaccharide biosynthesis tyrosine autokinase [Acetobacter nitrogenifigens]GBQ98262.1 putative succinoglycan biosynthesis transport protein [Acetobacter nitrogenifigens DSM 23921 = NBRC 105050]GEN58217.1 polysaccharide biosynthesis protein [Acetobacter nitrogenifigens DSM 23921 = NBRC 105050]
MNALQIPSFNGPPPSDTQDTSHVSPLKIFSVIRRHWLAVSVTTVLIGGPACVGIGLLSPYYDASSSLMIGTKQAPFRDLQATQSPVDVDTVAVNTEVGILRSSTIATSVAQRLDLVDAPYFRNMLDAVPLKRRIVDAISRLLGETPDHPKLSPAERLQATRDALMNRITVLNDGRSYIITVTARTGDATLSSQIANAYADVYLDFKRHLKISATWRANGLLDEQIVPLRDRLRKAEQAVEQFREKNDLVSTQLSQSIIPSGPNAAPVQEGTTIADQQLVETNRQLIEAQSELEAKRAHYAEMHSGGAGGSSADTTAVLSSPIIQQLQAQEAELNARAASLASTAGDANPELRAARAAAAHVQRQINAEIAHISASSGKDLQSAQAKVAALTQEVQRLQGHVSKENRANVTLRQLESEASAARAVYQDYLSRFAQTSTAAELQEPEADLITRADKPLSVSGPPRMQLMVLALVASSLLGVGVALALDRNRKGVRSPVEMDSVPGLFTLGMVPSFTGSLTRLYHSGATCAYVEMVESIRAILSFGQSRFRAKSIVVTSPGPDEGKTTFALSLAANTGRSGKRALLIDCDTHGPSAIQLVAGVGRSPHNSAPSLQDSGGLARDVLPGVDVMTMSGGGKGGGRMVSPSAIGLVLAELSPHYDMIILDTPPVLAFPDAAVLSHQTDGVVVLAKWGTTTQASIKEAMRQMQAYDAKVLGGVLNQAPMRGPDSATTNQIQIYSHYGLLAS